MTHEEFQREKDRTLPSNRSVGVILSIALAVIAVAPAVHGAIDQIRWWALVPAGGIAALTAFRPNLLTPLNRAWMGLGAFLHAIVNPVVLAIMFYGVMTPIGVLMRLFGNDPLKLKPAPQSPTYWVARVPPGPSAESMKNQF